jgi:hypothetical protein
VIVPDLVHPLRQSADAKVGQRKNASGWLTRGVGIYDIEAKGKLSLSHERLKVVYAVIVGDLRDVKSQTSHSASSVNIQHCIQYLETRRESLGGGPRRLRACANHGETAHSRFSTGSMLPMLIR